MQAEKGKTQLASLNEDTPQPQTEATFRLHQIIQVNYIKSCHTLISILLSQKKYSECITHANQLEATVESELIEGPIACNMLSVKSRSYLMLGDFEKAYEIGIKGVE